MSKCKPTDLWRTPKELFNTLYREFGFIADMAASDENKLSFTFFDESDDSLSFNWLKVINPVFSREFVWCNPPYSNPKPWVKKALEAQKDGLGVVMLLNADDSTEWFHEALKGVSEIRRITGYVSGGKFKSGRVSFLGPDNQPVGGNNKAQFLLIFDPFKIGANVTSYVRLCDLVGY